MAYTTPPWMFSLQGTFLGFLEPAAEQSRTLLIETDQEQMPIQLPWRLAPILDQLRPGDPIHCIGRSQLDLDAGVISLTAYQLISLASVPL